MSSCGSSDHKCYRMFGSRSHNSEASDPTSKPKHKCYRMFGSRSHNTEASDLTSEPKHVVWFAPPNQSVRHQRGINRFQRKQSDDSMMHVPMQPNRLDSSGNSRTTCTDAGGGCSTNQTGVSSSGSSDSYAWPWHGMCHLLWHYYLLVTNSDASNKQVI